MRHFDAVGNEVMEGNCVVYIGAGRIGNTLRKGVVTKLTPKMAYIQPLKTRVINDIKYAYGAEHIIDATGNFRVAESAQCVHRDRMAVVNGYDWEEYKDFIRWNLIPFEIREL